MIAGLEARKLAYSEKRHREEEAVERGERRYGLILAGIFAAIVLTVILVGSFC
jgi:hypothetical protein